MNPQPVSLAEGVRKLVERLHLCYPVVATSVSETESRIADELSALLDQHAVAEPPEVSDAPVCSFCGKRHDGFCSKARQHLDAPAHAAEQPKLTGEQCAIAYKEEYEKFRISDRSFTDLWQAFADRLNALLTSPVAPPPQIDHCPTCKSEQKGDTKNLVGHFPCLDLWHTTPHNSTKNPRLPYCKTENCWSWRMTGSEYCALHQPPVAPGEQPPRECICEERGPQGATYTVYKLGCPVHSDEVFREGLSNRPDLIDHFEQEDKK